MRLLGTLRAGGGPTRHPGLLFAVSTLVLMILVALLAPQSIARAADGDQRAVSVDSVGPTALSRDDTLTVSVTVTNPTDDAIEDARVDLGVRTALIGTMSDLDAWLDGSDGDSAPQATEATIGALPAGGSTQITLSVAASQLSGLSRRSTAWGPRGLVVSLRDGADGASAESIGQARSVFVWVPGQASDSFIAADTAILLPMDLQSRAAPLTLESDSALTDSVTSGRLADLEQLGGREGIDWWLDPALLDLATLHSSDEAAPASDASQSDEGSDSSADASGQTALAGYSDRLSALAGGRNVYTMPYANADLESLEAANASRLATAATDLAPSLLDARGIRNEGLLLAPSPQTVDTRTLEDAASLTSTVLLPDASAGGESNTRYSRPAAGRFNGKSTDLSVLLPNSYLSDALASPDADLTAGENAQEILGMSALIARERPFGSNPILISPDAGWTPDAETASAELDALDAAPWLHRVSTSDAAAAALEDPSVTSFQPAGRTDDGSWEAQDSTSDVEFTSAGGLQGLQSSYTQTETLASALDDATVADSPRRLLLAATSTAYRDHPGAFDTAAAGAERAATNLSVSVGVVAGSPINIVATTGEVPIVLSNELDTDVTVTPRIDSTRPIVNATRAPEEVTIPAGQRVTVRIPIRAVTNGTSTLQVELIAADGQVVGTPGSVGITVNAQWEQTTTYVLGAAMAVLMVFGIVRARNTRRRKGSTTRAPAERGPERTPEDEQRD